MERATLLGRLSWQLGEVVATQAETARFPSRNRRHEFRGTRTQTNPSQDRAIRTNRRTMMEMKLDSNAAGGMWQFTFPFDMTLLQAHCAGCGPTTALRAPPA